LRRDATGIVATMKTLRKWIAVMALLLPSASMSGMPDICGSGQHRPSTAR